MPSDRYGTRDPARVLIVEDERLTAAQIGRFLSGLGYHVVGIDGSGESAIETARETRPDVVLMDIVLEGKMDGIEAAQAISSSVDTAVVFLTSHSGDDFFDRAKEIAPYGYLMKPVSPIELERTMEIALFKHQMERRLKRSEERFRALFSEAPIGIALLESDLRFISVNPAICAMLGYSEAELLTLKLDAVAHPEDEEKSCAGMKKLLDGEVSAVKMERRLKRKTGDTFWGNIAASLIRLEGDGPPQLLVHMEDVTERIRAQEAIKESEERFRQLAENIHEVFWLADLGPPKRVVYVSPAYERIWGRDVQGLYSDAEDWARPILEEDLDRAIAAAQDGVDLSGQFDVEYRIARPDGTTRWIWDRGFAVKDEAGTPRRVVGIAQDITKRKADEERQNLLMEELKHVAYFVSHDLRAPLVNIQGFSVELQLAIDSIRPAVGRGLALLSQEESNNARMAMEQDIPEFMGFIQKSVARMDHLIEAILKISRAGRRELQFERLDMNGLVEEVLAGLSYQASISDVSTNVDPLPHIVADRLSIEQILTNLLINALKYCDPTRVLRIEIGGERLLDETRFSVRDNGRGIPAGDVDRIFTMFERLAAQDVAGEGMGLAHVRNLVWRHHGRVWCESEPDRGSTFFFTISNHLGK